MEKQRYDYILNYNDNIPNDVRKILTDIVENHNWSWYKEISERNKNNPDSIALLYRGKKITFREMFENANSFAKSLKTIGIKKGDEIPMCMANCPETVYMLLAANMIGAKVNIFNDEFDKEYIETILNNTKSDYLFSTDNMFGNIAEATKKSNIKKTVLFSLCDSLPNGIDPYKELDDDFYVFENKVPSFKETNSIIDKNEFINSGKNYSEELEEVGYLDDEFLITYTSGSTNTSKPKAIIHRNSSPMVVARFHDKDASNLPTIKNLITLAQIPTHSNTDIITSISDTLSMRCTVALEPIYNQDFFLRSMIINKPNYVLATRCFWLKAFKEINSNPNLKDLKMPYLVMPTEVGEPLAQNEEKFLNRILRKVKAGYDIIPSPISPVCMSVGGGDCEHGGLFFTFFKALKQKLPRFAVSKTGMGLEAFKMVECAVLNENNEVCKPGELGRLVANSPCTMKEYKDNQTATDEFYIEDNYGRKWANCNVHAFIDKNNTVHMKGRMGNEITLSDGTKFPIFKVADEILKDTKGILSCEVINMNAENVIVAHLECQPNIKSESAIRKIIVSADQRCKKSFPAEVYSKIVFRYRDTEKAFPVTGCGKRNNLVLASEGMEETFKPVYTRSSVEFIPSEEYLNSNQFVKKLKK